MSASSERAIEEKVPWMLVIVLSAVLGFIVQPWMLLLPAGMHMYYSLGDIVCSLPLTTSSFIWLMLLYPLIKFKRVRDAISPTVLITIFIIGSSAGWYGTFRSAYEAFQWWEETRFFYPERAELVPWFMAPLTKEEYALIRMGGLIPWDKWAPAIIFWWFWFFINGLFFLSLTAILRKGWVDVEKIPFPPALTAYEVIRRLPVKEGLKPERALSPFILGVILGVIFNLPIMLTYLFPWFPDIYGWRTNTCGHGSVQLYTGTPLQAIVGLGFANKHPFAVALMYLAPLSVLFNWWFWWAVYLILMEIAYYMGYYTGFKEATTCCKEWGPISLRFDPPYKWQAFFRGAMIGLTIFYLVTNWSYIRDTLRAALGRSKEFEKGEPISYKMAYLLFTVSFLAIMAIMLICGLSVVTAFLMPVTIFLFWLSNTRMAALTGANIFCHEGGNALYRLLIWPKAPEPITREFVVAATLAHTHPGAPTIANAGSFLSDMWAFKLANLTGVNNRSIFKVILVSQAIIPLTFILGWLWINYSVGSSRLSVTGFSYAAPIDRFANPANWNRMPGTDPWAHIFLIGIIAAGVISWLHARFVWFPFEPIGFTLAVSDASIFFGLWSPALVAWILKTITLRVGGSKLYENYGIPVASGFMIGFVAVCFLGGLIGIYRFFFPF
jgi:hypothetical protein